MFEIEGQPTPEGQNFPLAEELFIDKDYFRALGIPVMQGRHLDETDNPDSPPVALINQTMARRYFPDGEAVGKHIHAGGFGPEEPWITVVGVVGDVKYNGLNAEEAPTIYAPYVQQNRMSGPVYILLRASTAPQNLTGAVRHEVEQLDSDLPIANVKTGEMLLAESVGQPRFNTTLIAIFALVALVLAAVGIYGVISYSVTQRTHEIGIRMALGARSRDVLKLVIGKGMRLALIGVGVGLAAAFALTRLMENLLFKVSATDLVTYAAISVLLTGVALAACYIPARRATKVDPMVALRYE
jgi:putative ABC transport system permease protein